MERENREGSISSLGRIRNLSSILKKSVKMRKRKAVLKATANLLAKQGRLASKVWEDYTKSKGADGREWATCKHCNKKFVGSSKSGTTLLKNHLERCPLIRRNRDGGVEDSLTKTGGLTTPAVTLKENLMIDQKLLNYFDEVLMISKRESTSTNSMKADDVLHVYKEEKEKLSKYFSELSCLFSLTIDCVQEHAGVYLCLAVHFIDSDWKLKNKILSFRYLRSSTCPRPSLETFKSLLLDWNMDKRVFCTITFDNIVDDRTENWLSNDLPFSGKLLQVGCFAHLFRAFTFGANFKFGVLSKLWTCCDYVRQQASSSSDQDIETLVLSDETKSSLRKIVTSKDVVIKSEVNLKYLAIALEFEEAFCELERTNPNFKSMNLTKEEWAEATTLYEFLKLLDDVVRDFSLDGCPTANVYFPKVCEIYTKLHSWENSDYWDLREAASYMRWEFFDEYWENSSLVLAIAAVLDPRFKMDIVQNWFEEIYGSVAHEHVTKITEHIALVCNNYASVSNLESLPSTLEDTISSTQYKMLDRQGRSCPDFHNVGDVKSANLELDRYLKEPKFPAVEEFDILSWWRINTPKFPTLARMARDFLAIPALTSLFDSSLKSQINNIIYSKDSTDPDIIEVMLCTKNWSDRP